MTTEPLAEILRRERVPYHDKERLYTVLGLLLSGRISLGKASDLLGIRVDELWDILRYLGVDYPLLDEEEAEEEIEAYRRIFKSGS